ncbi:unnamed protein product, partial [Nesidiocoris tenuis]
MKFLLRIIEEDTEQEIRNIELQTAGGSQEIAKDLTTEPKDTIDDWVERLRAYIERETMILCAQKRRMARLAILEAFSKLKNKFKEEIRQRIHDKMNTQSDESDKVIHDMLYQAVVLLLEPTAVIHMRKSDIKRVEKQYDSVIRAYHKATGSPIKMLTSRHYLKEPHYGRLVITNKDSSIFIDSDLRNIVDRVADVIFSQHVSIHPFLTQKPTADFAQEALKYRGLQIMPRSPRMTQNRLETLLNEMSSRDPRNNPPVFHLVGEKKEPEEEKRVFTPELSPKRKVRLGTELGLGSIRRISTTTGSVPKYAYHQIDQHDSESESRSDVYNFEAPSSTDVLIITSSVSFTSSRAHTICLEQPLIAASRGTAKNY